MSLWGLTPEKTSRVGGTTADSPSSTPTAAPSPAPRLSAPAPAVFPELRVPASWRLSSHVGSCIRSDESRRSLVEEWSRRGTGLPLWMTCCAAILAGTKHLLGRVTASPIASTSPLPLTTDTMIKSECLTRPGEPCITLGPCLVLRDGYTSPGWWQCCCLSY